jgi:hypothetical protein
MEGSGERTAGEQRRYLRFRYIGVIFLSWVEPDGNNHVMGRCIDISEGGLGIEISRRISVGAEVRVRADWVKLDGIANVRHIREQGGGFQIGLELKEPLPSEALAELAASEPAGSQSAGSDPG